MIKLDELEVYKLAMEIAHETWHCVQQWQYYHKDTLGKQLIRAADSIALNISEGYGRFSFKENKMFCYYARARPMKP
jgi:four helix bundle protein